MNGLGNGDNGEFTFMDLLSLCSFMIALENLNLNNSQDDKQDLQSELTKKSEDILNEIHEHLNKQDKKLDYILKELENDSRRGLQ